MSSQQLDCKRLMKDMVYLMDGDADFEACARIIRAVLEGCDEQVIRSWCGMGSGFNVFGTKRMALLIAVTALQLATPSEMYEVVKQSSGEYWNEEEDLGFTSYRNRLLELIKSDAPVCEENIFPEGA